MARRPEHSNGKLFNLTWCALHLVNAAGVAIILMNIGSARYHWKRVTNAPAQPDPHTDADSH